MHLCRAGDRNHFFRCSRHDGKPFLSLRLGREFVIVLEELSRAVSHFERNLVGGLHCGEPVSREAVSESIVNEFELQGFERLSEGAE